MFCEVETEVLYMIQLNITSVLHALRVHFPSPYLLHFLKLYPASSLPLGEGRTASAWRPSELCSSCNKCSVCHHRLLLPPSVIQPSMS